MDDYGLSLEAEQLLRETLDILAQEIRANHEEAGQVASGRLRDSIVPTVENLYYQVNGHVDALPYVETTELGTPPWDDIPTKDAKDGHTYEYVPEWFANRIGEWMKDKGLAEDKRFNRWSVAWGIIHNGTNLYQEGGRSDIYSEITAAAAEELADRLAEIAAAHIDTITLNLNTEITP